jgi:hypothetical protein
MDALGGGPRPRAIGLPGHLGIKLEDCAAIPRRQSALKLKPEPIENYGKEQGKA